MDVRLEFIGIEYLFIPGSIFEWVSLAVLTVLAGIVLRGELGRVPALIVSVSVLVAYSVMGDFSLAVAIALAAVGAQLWRRAGRPLVRRRPRKAALEILLVLGGYSLYSLARVHSESTYMTARENALRVADFEKSLGLFFEQDLQSLIIGWEPAVQAVTAYYQLGFFSTVTCVLLWLFLADDRNYRLMRNSLGISCLLATIAFSVFPTAPPRLMAEFGIVDTASMLGNPSVFANDYAAIASLHVGWMALAGYVLGRSIGGRLGTVVKFVPGVTMAFTVVLTGNHWWVDGVVGTVFALGPALLMVHVFGPRETDVSEELPAGATTA